MLFLLRPRQTRMPFLVPRSTVERRAHNELLQKAYSSTRRVAPAPPAEPDPMAMLRGMAELHAAGVLTDEEFAAQKAKLLDPGSP